MTREELKFVQSLRQVQERNRHQLFVVEGEKCIQELLQSDYEVDALYATSEGFSAAQRISVKEMGRISHLKTPTNILAVVRTKKAVTPPLEVSEACYLALDGLQNPGNMGTILRTAEWFGIQHIICSPNCVDVYNPKVIQASMGSCFRAHVHYVELENFCQDAQKKGFSLAGTALNGESIRNFKNPKKSILLFGNEGHGVSKSLQQQCTTQLTIPQYGTSVNSLNVAVSVGIILSHLNL